MQARQRSTPPSSQDSTAWIAIVALCIGIGFAAESRAQSPSLCDDFHVPAAHIGDVQGCATAGGTTTVTFNAPAILEWQRGFRVGAGQRLRFQFADDAGAAVLNRDLSGGNSNIAGGVTSNGRVLLVNPGGDIVVQAGGLIDADGGFLGSTIDTQDGEALLAGGGAEFGGGSLFTGILNRGTIRSANGDVILIGGSVINHDTGQIVAPTGSVFVGAGTRIRLAFAGEPRIAVLDGDGQHLITNDGLVQAADTIDLSAFAPDAIPPGENDPAIANYGILRTISNSGRVFLRALPGNSQVLNSPRGRIETRAVAISGELINEGALIIPDDGSNPGAPTATRQFPRLTTSALAQTASSDFRLSRLSFNHLNGLESETGKESRKGSSGASEVSTVAENTTTSTRGSTEREKKKRAAGSAGDEEEKKIVLRRGAFFGKKTE